MAKTQAANDFEQGSANFAEAKKNKVLPAEETESKTSIDKPTKITKATRQKISEILKKKEQEKLFWREVVDQLIDPTDFLALFEKLKIREWENSQSLTKNNFEGLKAAIVRGVRFKDWNDFKKFMGLETKTMVERVLECSTKEDFYKLFKELGISYENNESIYYQNTALTQAIRNRFGSLENFSSFMGKQKQDS